MSTQVQTVQNSGYQSLTRAAIGRVKDDKRFAHRVLNAVSVPLCAIADCFRAPAHFVANRLIHPSPEATVTEGVESQNPDVSKAVDKYFKTLSAAQILGKENAHRVKYNHSVNEAVKDFSKFAEKHRASDALQVLQSLKRQVKEKYGCETVRVEEEDFPTEITQLYGIKLENYSGRMVVRGFLSEVRNRENIGSTIMQKAIAELQENLSKDPLSDTAIPEFNNILVKLKKLGMVTQDQVKSAISGEAGKAVAEAFSTAGKQQMIEASQEDLDAIRKTLTSHSAALSAAFGFKGINMRGLFREVHAARQKIETEERQVIIEQREGLEKQAHELEDRLALEQKVKDAAEKIKNLELQLKSLRRTPNAKMAALIKKIQAGPNEEELKKLLKQLDEIKKEAKQKIAEIKKNGQQNQVIQTQIKKLENDLTLAIDEQKQAIAALAQFKKEHGWMVCPQFRLKKVQAKLAQFDEGMPVVQAGRRRWVVPAVLGSLAAAGAGVAAVIYKNPVVYGVALGDAITNARTAAWGYGRAGIENVRKTFAFR